MVYLRQTKDINISRYVSFFLFFILMLSISSISYSQTEEQKELFKNFTGKNLEDEISKIKTEDNNLSSFEKDTSVKKNLKSLNSSILLNNEKQIISNSDSDKSYFEKYVDNEIIDPYKSKLKQYKLNFANLNNSISYNKKIPADYYPSVGDEVIINIWGALNKKYTIKINRENYIIIPDIGKVIIDNMSYKMMVSGIESRLNNIDGIEYDIRMGRINPIKVKILGNINKPGVYNISPFNNVIEIISLAGGVLKEASLRNIIVISEDGSKRKIDLYNELFFQKHIDFTFSNGDILFLPLIDKQVAIAGNVKREGIYEIKTGEKLSNLFEISGITPFSDKKRIEIERISSDGKKSIISTNSKDNVVLRNGDIIRIFSTLVFNNDFIYLSGNFRHNKDIEFKKGLMLSDIFKDNSVIKDDTDLSYGIISRRDKQGKRNFIINFSPSNFLATESDRDIELIKIIDIELNSRDTVKIFSYNDTQMSLTVNLKGEIRFPGKYKFENKMKVSDLIKFSGGITNKGDLDNVLVTRKLQNGKTKYFSSIDPQNFDLEPFDKIFVPDLMDSNPTGVTGIFGAIKKPGYYDFSEDMAIADLIILARGLTNKVLKDSIEVARGINDNNDKVLIERYSFKEAMEVKLFENDIIYLKNIPEYAEFKRISITGKVKYPGSYIIKENDKYSDLLLRCGGYEKDGDIDAIRLYRKSVKDFQNRRLKLLQSELNENLKKVSIREKNENILNMLQVTRLKNISLSGRTVVDFTDSNISDSFILEDKDSIFVPSFKSTIMVLGEVMQQTSIAFEFDNPTVGYYLEKVGGLTDFANGDKIHIIRANGQIIQDNGFFSSTLGCEVKPGDIIYVPFDYDMLDTFQVSKDIISIIYQLSLSAASIYNIVR